MAEVLRQQRLSVTTRYNKHCKSIGSDKWYQVRITFDVSDSVQGHADRIVGKKVVSLYLYRLKSHVNSIIKVRVTQGYDLK